MSTVSFTGAGATLDVSQSTASGNVGGLVSTGGLGTVTLGTKVLSIEGTSGSAGFNGVIQGSGTLALDVNAAQTLSGVNTYTGRTLIGAGATLTLTGGGSIAQSSGVTFSGSGAIFDVSGTTAGASVQGLTSSGGLGSVALGGKTLTLTGNANPTFSGVIGGTGGGLTVGDGTNAASQTLSGANTYTGGTTLNANATLALSGTGAIRSSTVGFTGAGATLDISQSAGSANIGGLASTGGFGTVETGTKQLSIEGTGGSAGFSGVIQGSGGLALDTNTQQALNGINTYTGGTVIQNGATLSLTGSGSIAASSGITFGTGTFDISGTTAGTSVTSLSSAVASAGTVALGGKTLTITGNANNTFSGAIGGSGGGLTIGDGTNAASQTLSGANTYTGATTVNANATLALGGSGSLSTSSGVTLSGTGATFDISNHTGDVTIKDLAGAAGSVVNLGSIGLAAGTSNNTTFAGVIQGSGAFTKQGSGILTFSGANTYTGTTSVDAGTLQAGAANTFASSSAVTVSSGATLDFNSFNNVIGSLAGSGNVALGSSSPGTMTLGGNNGTTIFSGVVSGTGNLVKEGSGTLTLSGNNTFAGTMNVDAGELLLAPNGALSSNAAVNVNGGQLVLQAGVTQTLAGMAINAPGSTTLGTNVQLTTGNLLGAGNLVMTGGNVLTIGGDNSSETYSGVISGSGTLIKTGSGTQTFSGANTYTGTTEVAAGKLLVTGSLTSNVTVDAGANFGGTGTITGNVTVNGTIRPDIGTMNIVGTYTQGAGSTYNVEVTAAGASDLINITGNAVITGGTVSVSADTGTYRRSTTYTILTASTGVTGSYAGVTSNLAFLRASLSYDTNDVFLTLLLTSSGFESGGLTPNQKVVGHTLDLGNAAATGDFNTVLNAISGLNTVQGPAALDAISGINYAGFQTLAVQSARAFMNAFGQQAGRGGQGAGHMALAAPSNDACESACETERRWGVWGGGMGSFGTIAGNIDAQGYSYNLGGFAAGIDYKVDPHFTAGVAVGYTGGTLWTQGLPGQGNSDEVQLGLYGQFSDGALYVDGLAGYAHGQNRLTRPILVPGLNTRIASGSTTLDQAFGMIETGYKLETGTGDNAYVTPFARLQGSTATQAAFSETGADSLDLNVETQTTNSLRTVLGARVGWTMLRTDLRLQAGWSHEFADNARPVTASFSGAPAFPFTVQGVQSTRDGAVLGLMASAKLGEETSLYARYDGELEGGTASHTVSAGVRMTW